MDKKRLDELLYAEQFMHAMQGAGVDNWSGYNEAMQQVDTYEEQIKVRNELLDQLIDIMSEGIEEPAGIGAGFGLVPSALDQAEKLLMQYKVEKL